MIVLWLLLDFVSALRYIIATTIVCCTNFGQTITHTSHIQNLSETICYMNRFSGL